MNPLKEIRLEKVTLNMGVGEAGDELKRATQILKLVSNAKPVNCACKVKQPTWGIMIGLPIGVKTTLRGAKAVDFLEKAFQAKDKHLKAKSFDKNGNFGFGIKEYIDLPHVKYDPKLGITGLDVLVTLERKGFRVKRRKLKKSAIGKHHKISKEEAMAFVKERFGVEVE
jgi:large subunit ribosomal protein L5